MMIMYDEMEKMGQKTVEVYDMACLIFRHLSEQLREKTSEIVGLQPALWRRLYAPGARDQLYIIILHQSAR
jgi:hypothetical protein